MFGIVSESNQLQPVPSTSSQSPILANDFSNRNGVKYGGGVPSKTPSSEGMEEIVNGEIVNGIGPDHHNAPSTSPIQKKRAYFDEEVYWQLKSRKKYNILFKESSDPDLKEIGERRMSTRSAGAESSSNPVENRKAKLNTLKKIFVQNCF